MSQVHGQTCEFEAVKEDSIRVGAQEGDIAGTLVKPKNRHRRCVSEHARAFVRPHRRMDVSTVEKRRTKEKKEKVNVHSRACMHACVCGGHHNSARAHTCRQLVHGFHACVRWCELSSIC